MRTLVNQLREYTDHCGCYNLELHGHIFWNNSDRYRDWWAGQSDFGYFDGWVESNAYNICAKIWARYGKYD